MSSLRSANFQLTKMMLPVAKYPQKSPYKMNPTRIVIHNTANSVTAMQEASYVVNGNGEASYHYAVDESRAVQILPLDRNGWHAGDGANGVGNRYGIGIEIARSTGDMNLFLQAEKNGAYLTAVLLKQFGWGIEKVTKHQDYPMWSSSLKRYTYKYCPHKTLDLGWVRFINMVKNELALLNQNAVVAPNVNSKIKIKQDAKHYANTPSPVLIPDIHKGKEYTVMSVSNDGKVLVRELFSWVYITDLEGYGVTKPVPAPSPVPTKPETKLESERYLPRTVVQKPYMRLKVDAKMHSFNAKSWGDIKEVASYKKGDEIELADIVKNPMGRRYGRSTYSYEKNLYNGFNVVDFDIIWK